MSFNKGTNIVKRVNQANLVTNISNISIHDAYKIANNYYYFITSATGIKYVVTNNDIFPTNTSLYTQTLMTYNGNTINAPNALQKGCLKDGIIYNVFLLYNNIDDFTGLNLGGVVKGWITTEFNPANHTFTIKSITPHSGSVDGDHSLIYTSNTPDGNGKFYICGRARRANPDWGTAPNGSGKTIDSSVHYTIANDPRKQWDDRTISFASDIWDDRRGIKLFASTSISGPFTDVAVRNNSNGGDSTTYVSGWGDPRQIYTEYDTSKLKQDLYGNTSFAYKNYNFYLNTVYFKDEDRYSPIRKGRRTGDGSMKPQVIFSKDSVDFKVVTDWPEGVTDIKVAEQTPFVSSEDFNRIWYTPAPSAYYPDATNEVDLFRDEADLQGLLNRTFAGPAEIGQIYIHTFWESADNTSWYFTINDAARPHYHAGNTGEWYITGQNGLVTYTGTAPNIDITGSISFQIAQIQEAYKWEHLTTMLSQADSISGTLYTFNSVNKIITVNGQTKTLKAHLEDVPINKFPFYRWVKHSLNYFKDGSYGLNKAGKDYLVNIRKEAFAYFTKTTGSASGTITTNPISITSNIQGISINCDGNITIQIKNTSNVVLQTIIANINSTDYRQALITGLPAQVKVSITVNSGKFYSFKFLKNT